MPSKKKKYNARFPAGRIKKIMQTDEEIGKVAQAVPVIISRTLELFVESLLTKSMQITQARSAKTLTPSHMKQCILSESRFDFLKDLVKNIPDPSAQEDNENNANEALDFSTTRPDDPQEVKVRREIAANFYTEQSTSMPRPPPTQYTTAKPKPTESKLNFSINNLVKVDSVKKESSNAEIQINLTQLPGSSQAVVSPLSPSVGIQPVTNDVPPMMPLSHNPYGSGSGENNLYIDEDYDN